jgi:hypothetical protein
MQALRRRVQQLEVALQTIAFRSELALTGPHTAGPSGPKNEWAARVTNLGTLEPWNLGTETLAFSHLKLNTRNWIERPIVWIPGLRIHS